MNDYKKIQNTEQNVCKVRVDKRSFSRRQEYLLDQDDKFQLQVQLVQNKEEEISTYNLINSFGILYAEIFSYDHLTSGTCLLSVTGIPIPIQYILNKLY